MLEHEAQGPSHHLLPQRTVAAFGGYYGATAVLLSIAQTGTVPPPALCSPYLPTLYLQAIQPLLSKVIHSLLEVIFCSYNFRNYIF